MSVFVDNLVFALVVAALFWLVSQGFMYNITNGIASKVGFPLLDGTTPNLSGVILHGLVLGLLVVIARAFIIPCKEGFKLPEKEDEKNKKN